MMTKIVEWLRLHFIAAIGASGILGAFGGAVINDFTSWRNSNRDFLKAQTEASQKADQDLIDILRKFSNKALGKASTTEDDLKNLQANVAKSYMVAEQLAERLPAIKNDFDAYADALISVQKTAEKLKGAEDGQHFVEAVSNFADKRQSFQRRVASLQTRWPL